MDRRSLLKLGALAPLVAGSVKAEDLLPEPEKGLPLRAWPERNAYSEAIDAIVKNIEAQLETQVAVIAGIEGDPPERPVLPNGYREVGGAMLSPSGIWSFGYSLYTTNVIAPWELVYKGRTISLYAYLPIVKFRYVIIAEFDMEQPLG